MTQGSDATALLVIDVQVGVVETCYNVPEVVSNITDLVKRARQALVPVIWVQHEDGGLVRDSPGWQMVPELPKPLDNELRIYKKYRDSFTVPELEDALRKQGIKHLVLTGAQSDYCVRSTAHGAAARGFSITLPRDAHTTEDSEYDGVEISAKQIIHHVNSYFHKGSLGPDVKCDDPPHDQVVFSKQAA